MRILVVEDEHKIANDLALTEDYDVIILDLMLPRIDGLEICHRLREENIHTPILILTAKGQLTKKVEGLNSGADDYLVKPFAFTELLARIRALIRRPKDALGYAKLSGQTWEKRNSTFQKRICSFGVSFKE